ncbi:MAG: glutathione S-transferase family protein [Paracoccus sp. (in: a-proteobacteria)]|nr:glutathione S-transferase family protein [Paracoccus sp. (in: a-proteobacteria)]
MLTLYHSPQSRSTSVVQLIEEMGVRDQIDIRTVTIPRQDGSGARDPANPHPEGKVPYLVDGDDTVRERAAAMIYLTDRFESPLGRPVGHKQRGLYLSWMVWYQSVFEPVGIFNWAKLDHPVLYDTFRDYDTAIARLDEVLSRQPYLLGADFSAADMLISGVFGWAGDMMPAPKVVKDWADRCNSRPEAVRVAEAEAGKPY